jgi:Bacteriophage minor capsid protein
MSGDSLISEGVAEILTELSIGVFQTGAASTDWVIAIGRHRDKPNRFIAVLDTGGLAPEPGLDINYPSVQIYVRGEPDGYKDTHAKCREIKRALLGRLSETRGGDIWASISMPHDVHPIGVDANERPQFTLNFDLVVHQGNLVGSSRRSTD